MGPIYLLAVSGIQQVAPVQSATQVSHYVVSIETTILIAILSLVVGFFVNLIAMRGFFISKEACNICKSAETASVDSIKKDIVVLFAKSDKICDVLLEIKEDIGRLSGVKNG